MANSTDLFWSVDGVSLQTFTRNIETLGGGRESIPDFRGTDVTVPYRRGDRYVPKTVASRVITLGMWAKGNTADDYKANFNELRQLLWQEGRQFQLQKRIRVNGLVRSVTALGEFNDGLEPSMIGRSAGKFSVGIKLADPYFYDDELTSTSLVNNVDTTINVLGDAITDNVNIQLTGAITNPLIRNKTLGMQVEYRAALLSGGTANINCDDWTSYTTPSGSPQFDSEASIRHQGAPQWLRLKPGANIINRSSTFGTGPVILQHRGAWL